jgi:hypothetical protein
MALWPFAAFAVADFVDPRQMPAGVVAESTGQVVDAFFSSLPVQTLKEHHPTIRTMPNLVKPDITPTNNNPP